MGFLINCSDTSILLCDRQYHPSSVKDPWACWVMTLAKQALTCEPSIGPQMHGCRGQTMHAGSWLQPPLSFHCFPQMSSPSSITLSSQVPSAWETLLSFLHPASSPWLAPSKMEGLCADVPGERPAPLPWENMWSGSVYAGALSSCLPHSMLASDSAMTMLNPPPTGGAFSGWGDTSNHVDTPGEAVV